MPGWHEAMRELREAGKVRMIGIVQEQHPDRARLFMQWKEMGWPVLADPLDLLGLSVVPVTVAIDEHGIVRAAGLRVGAAAGIGDSFVSKSYEAPSDETPAKAPPPDLDTLERAAGGGSIDGLLAWADALVLWGGDDRLADSISAYERALNARPGDGAIAFRLGVAHRLRYDSDARRAEDFRAAVASWQAALDADPNQYIWRRRIQQYGPRSIKPYPFYDWIDEARVAIGERGETPVALQVEPAGAEIALPARSFESDGGKSAEPDPEGKIARDRRLIDVELTVVPEVVNPGGAVRVHLTFTPDVAAKGHWNNEVDGLAVWINTPEGWQVDRSFHTVPNATTAVSTERRQVEFELASSEDASAGETEVRGYALYYVCEDVKGTCLYRRQDLTIPIRVRR